MEDCIGNERVVRKRKRRIMLRLERRSFGMKAYEKEKFLLLHALELYGCGEKDLANGA